MEDIVPALLETLQRLFDANIAEDSRLQALLAALAEGGGGYAEAGEAAWQIGEALARALAEGLTAEVLPDGRLYWNIADRALRPLLEQGYTIAAGAAATAQQGLNAAAGLGLRAQAAPVNADRIDGILNAAVAKESFEEASALLSEPVVTLMQSAVDETLRRNVEFQGRAGLRPRVVRRAERGACPWCRALAGVYRYPDLPQDVYRRHENCRCVVEYDPGGGRRQDVWSKQWTEPAEADILEERKQLGLRSLARELATHPGRFAAYTPQSLKDALEADGFEVKPLKNGSLKNISFEDGGGYKVNFEDGGLLQYHPADKSHHGGAYYKISTGKEGKRRYELDGKPKKD